MNTHDGLEAERVDALPENAEFALCLTHDVDRPYKGIRSLYYAMQDRPTYHLRSALAADNPYWQFEEIMRLEEALGVRSAWYFLNEQHLLADRPPRDWLTPAHWIQHLGRYDVTSEEITAVVRALADGGWEVGLHGSYHTADDRRRLEREKTVLEGVLGERVVGGRQHHLRLSVPDTWRHHREIGLAYDASLGSTTDCGFQHGYRPIRPFGDEFVVFPLTIMDQALPDPGETPRKARDTCEDLIQEAADNDAVMTVLWHPRYFNDREFPGHDDCYRWLIERARELGGWIGAPRAFLSAIESDADPERSTRASETADGVAEPGTKTAVDSPARSSSGGTR